MITQELKKGEEGDKVWGSLIREKLKRCTEKVKEERSKTGKYKRKRKLKRIVFVLWPNSLEQLSS